MTIPPQPVVPASQQGQGEVPLRYEDISQDGRVVLHALPNALASVMWRRLPAEPAESIAAAMRDAGIVPILTRMVLEGGGGPLSVRGTVRASGCFDFAHTVDPAGAVDRILLGMWATLEGQKARTHGPPPPDAGAPVVVGRVFADHVFTRPFAPPGQRKVLRLDLEAAGLPPVPPTRRPWPRLEAIAELPEGARALEEPAPDAAPVVFGIVHTDSNQHVNSLVYPRMFEEAALRRFASLGRPTASLFARGCELGWRKPCFAGDRLRIVLRAYEREGRLGATGVWVADGDPPSRPHAYVRMEFDG